MIEIEEVPVAWETRDTLKLTLHICVGRPDKVGVGAGTWRSFFSVAGKTEEDEAGGSLCAHRWRCKFGM